jgi:hypothetical protein
MACYFGDRTLADTDAGNVVTGAQAGAQWGYRLLPLLLGLMPMLYMVQELTVRLGGHWSGLQSMDDLLPTGRHCRQETAAR